MTVLDLDAIKAKIERIQDSDAVMLDKADARALVAEVERLRAIITEAGLCLRLPYPGQSWASSLNARSEWARSAESARAVLRRESSDSSSTGSEL